MEKENNISKVIFMVIGIIIFVSFLAVLSTYITSMINPTTGSDTDNLVNFTLDTHTLGILSTYPTAECFDINITNSTSGDELAGPGNYTFYSSNCSYVVQESSPYINNSVNISYIYEYEQDGYIGNSTTRYFLYIIVGLFSLVIIGYLISYLLGIFGSEVGE